MNQEYFENIVGEMFKKFMHTFFGYEFKKYNLFKPKDDTGHFDNVIFISLFGGIEGGFLLEVDNSTAKTFLTQVHISLKQEIDFHHLVKGYIGEFGNILASRIATNLGRNFGDTFLSTPSLFSGTGMVVDLFYEQNYRVCIDNDFGIFKIGFSFT
ncbi:MAG: hypothetical protein OEV44_01500 [Spirochaetota bacterium]|nr:hypothetical protein [Spirochaetota bacterium]